MKQLLSISLLVFVASSCGKDEAPDSAAGNDPLDQVPTAEEAAQEADSIDAGNAEKTLDELEAELNSDG
jgi:hypothetical protein